MPSYEYDVAISFAGEDRPFARELAAAMQARDLVVFFDENERADTWGRSLTTRLTEIYESKAQYCLMLISQHYVRNAYTNLEREAAQARRLYDRDYILPVRLDDSEVPGLLATVACLMVPPETADSIARALVVRKGGWTPMSLLDEKAQRKIREIMRDETITASDKVLLSGLHFTDGIDRRREDLLAELTQIDRRMADRMARRESLMAAKEETYTRSSDRSEAAGYQDQIDALGAEGKRDQGETERVMAELGLLNEARQWYLDQTRDVLQRSSATIRKLFAS